MKTLKRGWVGYMAAEKQTDIFDFLNEKTEDEIIHSTVRISKLLRFGEYKREEIHFTSKEAKERYLKSLDIVIHRKSKFKDGLEYIVVNV